MDLSELPKINHFRFNAAPCPICGADDKVPRYRITKFEQGELNFVTCKACQTVYQDPRPDPASMQAFYETQNFFQGAGEKTDEFVGYVDYDAEERTRLKNARYRLREVEALFQPGRKLRILKIACGYGTFIKVARDAGHDAQGIDFSRAMVDGARTRYGIELIAANFLEHDFGEQTFDCVLLYGAINNFVDIRALGKKVSALLAPGGLYLSNFIEPGSIIEKLQGNRFWLYRPPIIGIWTARGFIAAHQAFGLEPLKVISDVQWISFGKILGYLQLWRSLKIISRLGLDRIFVRIPTPGYVKVVLRRPE